MPVPRYRVVPGRERAIEVVGVRAWMPLEVKSSKVLPKKERLGSRERRPETLERPVPVRSEKESVPRLKEPPEMERPLEVESPAVSSPPLKEEVALELYALKEEAEVMPETESAVPGVVVPTPALPVESTMKAVLVPVPVEVETAKSGMEERVGVDVPEMLKIAKGVVEPNPSFPEELVRVEVAVPVPRYRLP